MCDRTPVAQLRLLAAPNAPELARGFVAAAVCREHGGSALFDAQLVVSELVAAARSQHPMTLTVECRIRDVKICLSSVAADLFVDDPLTNGLRRAIITGSARAWHFREPGEPGPHWVLLPTGAAPRSCPRRGPDSWTHSVPVQRSSSDRVRDEMPLPGDSTSGFAR